METNIWKAMDKSLDRNIGIALTAASHMNASFNKKLKSYFQQYVGEIRQLEKDNLMGFPCFAGQARVEMVA